MNNHLFAAFKSRPYTYLWLGEIFTQIPVNLLNFLLVLIIFNLTKSNTAVSGIVLSFTLPAVLFGILAGVYIDRWNKRHVLLVCSISRAIFFILLAVFSQNVVIIFILSILITIVTQFFIPAESPIIPLLVKKEQLLSANALFGIGIFGSVLVAYLLSGPLLLYLGTVKTLLLLACMLLLSSFLIYLVKVPATEEKKGFQLKDIRNIPFSGMKKEVREVLHLIRGSRDIGGAIFLLALSQILILIIASIAPGYADQVLRISVEEFPLYVITPATVGLVAGAFIIANLLGNIKRDTIVTIGIFLSALVMIVMPYGSKIVSKGIVVAMNEHLPRLLSVSNIHIIVFLSCILGVAMGFIFVPSNTILQEKTSDEMRGKIYGVLNTVIGLFSFIPIIAVGSFSDLIGVSRVLTGIGCSFLLIGILKMIRHDRAVSTITDTLSKKI